MQVELLKLMDAGHRVNALKASVDTLTTTDLEKFLIEWVGELVDTGASDLARVANDHEVKADDLDKLFKSCINGDINATVEMLDICLDQNIDSPSILKERLERGDAFYDIVDEVGSDAFRRLAKIAELCN